MKVFDTNKLVEAQVLKLKMERKIQSLNFLIDTNEMYLKAMTNVGANTNQIDAFINKLNHEKDIIDYIEKSNIKYIKMQIKN